MGEHRNALQAGYRLHWYVIKSVLGQGGFGITYLAHDSNLDQAVAIKEYLPSEMAVRDAGASIHPLSGEHGESFRWGLERFIAEAQTLARFKHPNIVRVFTVFTENNSAYMVMEFEQGRGLHELLKEHKVLPEEELRGMLMPILDGLGQVHERGFIHRDIKPANIYIRSDGSPVLLDFGSARQAFCQVTRTLTAMVSPGFAPFEQYTAKGERQGPWTDIYGLGATLYRAAVGRAPADAMDRSEALIHTSRDVYVPAAEIRPEGYTESFLSAIDRAMAFRTEDRPQSIAEWRAAFGDVQGSAGTETAAPEATTFAAAAVGDSVGGDTVKIMIEVPDRAPPEPEETGATTPRPRRRRWVVALVVLAALVLVLFAARDRHRSSPEQRPRSEVAESSAEVSSAQEPRAGSTSGIRPPETDEFPFGEPMQQQTEVASAAPPARPPPTSAPEPGQTSAPASEPPRTLISARDRERVAELRRSLEQNPRDRYTRQQVRELVREYENRVKEAVRERKFDLAEAYIHEMLALAPDNEKLRAALRAVKQQRLAGQ